MNNTPDIDMTELSKYKSYLIKQLNMSDNVLGVLPNPEIAEKWRLEKLISDAGKLDLPTLEAKYRLRDRLIAAYKNEEE